jgi:thiamine-monophosphate kinase
MQIKDWSEDGFIKHLAEHFPASDLVCGIGDDCAVIPAEQEMAWLVTTDALVEGVHFLKEQISAEDLGYKTVAISVSDVAAMGGIPKYAFLSIALPKSSDCQWLHNLVEGIKEACSKWEILLLGGDTVGSKRDLFLSLTLIGSAEASKVKYRHLAKAGDILCVTGHLGDALGGLKALQGRQTASKESLIQAHFHPEVDVNMGIWLASQEDVHAMMDLSDGLDCDLKRLLKSSQCGAVVEVSKIPISDALLQTSLENGWDHLSIALSGGEDYCLLLTVSPEAFEELQKAFQSEFEMPLHAIGKITQQPEELIYQKHGETFLVDCTSFDHFQ